MFAKSVLITGGAGFIGSNFIPYFLEKYPDYQVINLDLLTYAGNLDNLQECAENPRYKFIQGNICNRALSEEIFEQYKITDIIHFAAESHVDNSIKNASVFIETNITGTYTLLDVAYKHWMNEPFQVKPEFSTSRFHHISTDEVYGSLGETGFFTETTAYAPNSPYSASKASADLIVRSYNKTFGLNTVITNCSNNFGPKQHQEKLIPTIIRNALQNKPIPIYGDGKNIRDWLYVADHCEAVDLVFHQSQAGENYNIGGENEMTNLQIANQICEILDKLKPKAENYQKQIAFVQDRPGHDLRYAIDASKIKKELGWSAKGDFESQLEETVKWYLAFQ